MSLLLLNSERVVGQHANQSHTNFKIAAISKDTTSTNAEDDETIGVEAWQIQERIVFLTGEITPELAASVIAQLLYLDHQAPGKDIYLYITSSGGDVTAGLTLYDTFRSLRSDVVTVALGEASSMASLLLATGTKGKRVSLPSTRIMIHQPWQGVVGGQASDIAIEAKEILFHRNKLNRLLSEQTGQPLKQIEVDTDRNFYLSAEEAKTYGIVDRTINQLPSASRPLSN